MVETARPRKLTVWRMNLELPLWLRRLKVAAYCRVSSKHDEQIGSLENQAAYYKSLIANNPHWELIEIFTDQRTARTMRRRTGLQRMLGLCRAHQIDLIITKSIKRFSRNTVDFLEVCNELLCSNLLRVSIPQRLPPFGAVIPFSNSNLEILRRVYP